MSERIEAAAKAEYENEFGVIEGAWEDCTPTARSLFREGAKIALKASDAILFSDAAIDRAAAALSRDCVLPWAQQPVWVKEAERAHVRAVIEALVGE